MSCNGIKVLIAAPLKQEPEIFREYQDALDRLIIPDGVTVDRFFVVNDCDEVIQEIRNAEYIVINTGDRYDKAVNDHIWTSDNLEKMPRLRNACIQRVRDGGYSLPYQSRHCNWQCAPLAFRDSSGSCPYMYKLHLCPSP